MKLDKNGYRSEKDLDEEGDVLAVSVKAWFIDGAKALFGAIVALVLIFAASFLQGCGGGGSDNAPVYDENGVCVNCNGNGDASVTSPDSHENGDTPPTYADGKLIPQPDTEPYVCPVSEPPKVCAPVGTWEAKCTYYDGPDANLCDKGALIGEYCTTDAECQKVPPDAWPPCVCWGLPCLLVGKWQCPSGSVMDFTDMEFYDNGDGYCRMHFPQYPSGDLYNKPGDDHVQRPPSGEPIEEKYTVLDGGSQLLGDGSTGTYTCTKLVEE